MSMVHASSGKLKPASPLLRSEPAIIAGMAKATLTNSKIGWMELVADYDLIRELIEQTIPGFDNYNDRIRVAWRFPYAAAADRTRLADIDGQSHVLRIPRR
ncbi:putative oxidoreductase [Citrobacter koseri]|uniref:Putative oxidoreductase n=1 Tax=Citrobacter koseri TaxID=545 RepID=A0A2X2XTX4_CITKO|nr:putative oxidoreductase [Citrobacter koseri]